MKMLEWMKTSIKLVISLSISTVVGFLVFLLMLAGHIPNPIPFIAGFIAFVFTAWKIMPKNVKEIIKNW